jgi:hypothetical protein
VLRLCVFSTTSDHNDAVINFGCSEKVRSNYRSHSTSLAQGLKMQFRTSIPKTWHPWLLKVNGLLLPLKDRSLVIRSQMFVIGTMSSSLNQAPSVCLPLYHKQLHLESQSSHPTPKQRIVSYQQYANRQYSAITSPSSAHCLLTSNPRELNLL